MLYRVLRRSVLIMAVVVTASILILHRPASVPISSTPTIESVQALSVLTVTKVNVADVIETELSGYTGSVRVLLIVEGDVTCGVDLSQARFSKVDPVHQSAMLTLPLPRNQPPRVDHDRTRIAAIWNSGVWTVLPGGHDADRSAVNAAYLRAQRRVAIAGDDPAVRDHAFQNAERVLRSFFNSMGWSVQIVWH